MSKKKAEKSAADQPTFEEATARLAAIVGDLEEGQIGLEQSLALFEEGVKLFRKCYESLERAERRIETLTGVDANGNPMTKPLEDTTLSLEEKARQRSRRRTAFEDVSADETPAPDEPGPELDEPGRLF